jgi:hypothetical protein
MSAPAKAASLAATSRPASPPAAAGTTAEVGAGSTGRARGWVMTGAVGSTTRNRPSGSSNHSSARRGRAACRRPTSSTATCRPRRCPWPAPRPCQWAPATVNRRSMSSARAQVRAREAEAVADTPAAGVSRWTRTDPRSRARAARRRMSAAGTRGAPAPRAALDPEPVDPLPMRPAGRPEPEPVHPSPTGLEGDPAPAGRPDPGADLEPPAPADLEPADLEPVEPAASDPGSEEEVDPSGGPNRTRSNADEGPHPPRPRCRGAGRR